jgi:hypothetical protein
MIACALTHGCSIVFLFITTSCELRGPFLPLRGEPHGFGVPPGRTTKNHQAPGLESRQTMTEVARVPGHGTHQVLRTAREHTAGALVGHSSPVADPFVLACQAPCCQRWPL